MKTFELDGKIVKIVGEFMDEKYGRVWDAYYDHKSVYIVEGKVVEEQSIIDELDNKYGIAVSDRNIIR